MLNTLPAPSAQVARNNSTVALADLVKVVRAEHLAVVSAFSSAVEHALAAGRALIEAKDLIGHGGWTKFLKDCDVGERTTRRYMQLAALAANRSSTTDLVGLTIEGAIKKLAPKAPAAWSKKPTPAAKPEETGRAVTPGDEALLGFTACFCDLLRRIRGRQPSRFARTAVASDDLNKLSKFLTELAQLKAAVPGAILTPGHERDFSELHRRPAPRERATQGAAAARDAADDLPDLRHAIQRPAERCPILFRSLSAKGAPTIGHG